MDWLKEYSNAALGPVQHDEAVFLYGLTLALRPRHVLEFGTYCGHSTRCFLAGGVGRVTSIDVRPTSWAQKLQTKFPGRLDLWAMDQVEFRAEQFLRTYNGAHVDLIFMDASHDLAANQETWREAKRVLANNGILVIHDTGCWARKHMQPEHHEFAGGEWIDAEHFAHQPGEVAFAAWLQQSYGANRIDIHSENTLRHGLSLFQFKNLLRASR